MHKTSVVAVGVVLSVFIGAQAFAEEAVVENSATAEVAVEAEASGTMAQPAVTAEVAVEATSSSGTVNNAPLPVVSPPSKPPNGLGLFFFGLRERISIFTTVDPVKKAEKQALFAEERLKIAERILGSNPNEEAKNRAGEVMKRAETLLEGAKQRQEKLKENPDARARAAIRNVANSQVRVGALLDRIEARLPESARDSFQERREVIEEKSQGLIRAVQNENMPAEVKEQLKLIQTRIEARAEAAKEFRVERQELLDKAKDGDEASKQELKELYAERKATLQGAQEEFKEAKESLREAAKNGNTAAERTLKAMDRVEGAVMERRDDARERQDVRREEVKVKLEGQVQAGDEQAQKRLDAMQKVDVRLDARDTRLDVRREEIQKKPDLKPLPPRPEGAQDGVKKESAIPAVRAMQRAKPLPAQAELRKAQVEAELQQ